MKRTVLACCLVALVGAAPAHAQVFGQFTPAHPITDGDNLFGGYLLVGDDTIGLLGQFRFTSSEELNWGLQAGFEDPEGADAIIDVGGDFRYIFHREDPEFPLDVAFGGAVGFGFGDNVTLIDIAPGLYYSHRFPLEGSEGAISPYGSILLDIQHVSIDTPVGDEDDTDLDVIARFGAEWEATRKLHLMAELQVGGDFRSDFNAGINVPF